MLAVDGQQMNIDGFARLKRPLWKRSKVTVDKKLAILDLYTSEKGFQFTADGKTAVEAEEGEGVITLKVPHKTRFVTVKHPDYGQLVWRVPKKWSSHILFFLNFYRHFLAPSFLLYFLNFSS